MWPYNQSHWTPLLSHRNYEIKRERVVNVFLYSNASKTNCVFGRATPRYVYKSANYVSNILYLIVGTLNLIMLAMSTVRLAIFTYLGTNRTLNQGYQLIPWSIIYFWHWLNNLIIFRITYLPLQTTWPYLPPCAHSSGSRRRRSWRSTSFTLSRLLLLIRWDLR